MTTEKERQGRGVSPSNEHGGTAYERLLAEHGADVGRLSRHTGWAKHTQVWVYELKIKYPQTPMGQHLVIVKGIRDGDPVVAFHSNDGLVPTLTSLGRRLEAGSVEWKEDQFTSNKYDEIKEAWQRLVKYHRG